MLGVLRALFQKVEKVFFHIQMFIINVTTLLVLSVPNRHVSKSSVEEMHEMSLGEVSDAMKDERNVMSGTRSSETPRQYRSKRQTEFDEILLLQIIRISLTK
jgi:hypothetical protein